jgi:nitrogen fixation NifU-like protein
MSGLDALYQDLLVSHSKNPHNRRALADASHRAHLDNPLCGDAYDVYLKLAADRIVDIGFEGVGCAISMASASLMTLHVQGRTPAEVSDLFARFARAIGGEMAAQRDAPPGEHKARHGAQAAEQAPDLGELMAFAGVARFPARALCARLPWDALAKALGR